VQTENISNFWQNVSAVKIHNQAKIQQSLSTMDLRNLQNPTSFTTVDTLESYVC
jgi:hypothetical protein